MMTPESARARIDIKLKPIQKPTNKNKTTQIRATDYMLKE